MTPVQARKEPMAASGAKRKKSASGEETRSRILSATLSTLKTDGVAGTSARAIARAGDFNQALIFYHFDSVDGAIVAAVGEMSRQRLERHQDRIEAASSLVELIDVAIELHADDAAEGNMTVLTQAFAGAAGNSDMGLDLYEQFKPWSEMVANAIDRVLGSSVLSAAVPTSDIARTISALFLGIELLDDLAPDQVEGAKLLETLRSLATTLELLMDNPLLQALGGMSTDPT